MYTQPHATAVVVVLVFVAAAVVDEDDEYLRHILRCPCYRKIMFIFFVFFFYHSFYSLCSTTLCYCTVKTVK